MSRRAVCPMLGKNLKSGIYSKMSKTRSHFGKAPAIAYSKMSNQSCFPFLGRCCKDVLNFEEMFINLASHFGKMLHRRIRYAGSGRWCSKNGKPILLINLLKNARLALQLTQKWAGCKTYAQKRAKVLFKNGKRFTLPLWRLAAVLLLSCSLTVWSRWGNASWLHGAT